MRREVCTNMLVDMIKTIGDGKLPAQVTAFYVFGSYARGAIEPHDLDVLVIYENADKAYWDSLDAEVRGMGRSGVGDTWRAFETRMRRALRKPGQRVDVILATALSHVVGPGSKIPESELRLLWSTDDQDYRPKLAAIQPDSNAGRAERNHLINIRRTGDSIGGMEQAMRLLDDGALLLTRLPLTEIEPSLGEFHQRRLELWSQLNVMGKATMRLLPYAMWWLEQHRQRSDVPDRTVIWSESRTHRVELGRPSLRWMIGVFQEFAKVKRQCLIPHIKATNTNELLIFEKGPTWWKHAGDGL